MDTAAFDYDLPPGRIAQVPVEPRDDARLLVDRGDDPAEHARVRDLPGLLAPGDLLVVNDTRVLPARLRLRRPTGGAVEVLLLERDGEGWEALVRPSRKVSPGLELRPAGDPGSGTGVRVLDERGEGRWLVRITGTGAGADGDDLGDLGAIAAMGEVPLPPYITERLADPERYQTVYARRPASAAAPTAGLHLTDRVLARLDASGVRVAPVELAVGLDTFRPIVKPQVEDHAMHSEAYRVPAETWDAVSATRAAGGRVVAVGTTVVRALESVAAGGPLAGRTELFIRPGYEFGAVDRLLTNYHTPRSSLLVLIAAFVGPRWRRLYDEAMAGGYRFLSFGDAMLLTRAH